MNFDKLWLIIESKNPNLKNDEEVRMTISGFKKAIKLAYDQGYKTGNQEGLDSKSVFDQMFGNRFKN